MEELKQYKSVFSKLGFCYLSGTAAVQILQMVISAIVSATDATWLDNQSIKLILSCVIVYGVGMPLILLLARQVPAEKPEKHPMKWWQFILAVMMCYAVMIVSNMIGLLLTALIGMLKGSAVQNVAMDAVLSGNMFLNFLLMVVLAPIMEEYVFRKVLVDRTMRYGQGVAIVVSGVMFGLFHGNLNQFAYAVMLGGFLAFLYIKTGNVKITMGIHAIINFMGSIVAPAVLKLINFDEMSAMDLSDADVLMGLVQDNLAGWIVYILFGLCIVGIVLAGLILFIVSLCCKKFRLESGEVSIPKGQKFNVIICNPGMILFCVVWIALIIVALLM